MHIPITTRNGTRVREPKDPLQSSELAEVTADGLGREVEVELIMELVLEGRGSVE